MRVVIVHNRYRSANPSGENRVVESDIDQLRADGVEVIPYIRDSDEIEGWTKLGKAGLAVRPIVSPVDAIAFRRLLKDTQPDIVHLHNPFPIISPWIIRTAKAQRIPVVQTVHNYRHVCVNGIHFRDGKACYECVGKAFPWPAVKHGCYQGSAFASVPMAAAVALHRGTWDLVDRFLPVGEGVAEHLRALGIEEQRITVRPNVVEDPGEPAPLGEGVLFVGRLSPEKGIDLLLDAWRLSGLGERTTLTIAGAGELRPMVEAACQSDPSVSYLGFVEHPELHELYRKCALTVISSRCAEADPVAALTALSHGRAVLSTNLGGAARFLGDDCGWLAEPSPNALASALVDVLRDPNELERRSLRARALYLRERAPSTGLDLRNVYTALCSLPRGSLAVVGPDGAGKSAVSRALRAQGENAGIRIVTAHFRPNLVCRPPKQGRAPVTEPHGRAPRPVPLAVAKLTMTWVDFAAGWAGPWRQASRRGLLLLERPWADQWVDPRRYRLPEAVRPVVRLLGALLRRADLAVLLAGDPAAIHARKPEIGQAEIWRQQHAWRRVLSQVGRRSVEIDAVGVPVEHTARATAAAAQVRQQRGPQRWGRPFGLPNRLQLHVSGACTPRAALNTYTPQRAMARGRLQLGVLAHAGGIARKATHPPVPIEDIAYALGLQYDGLVAMRSSAQGRWVVGLEAGGRLTTVVKAGPRDDAGLANETRFLNALAGQRALQVPELLYAGRLDDWYVVATAATGGWLRRGRPELAKVADVATLLSSGELCGYAVTHRDLAPWNLRVGNNELVLMDWEHASIAYRPLWDLAHYLVQLGSLVGALTPDEVRRLLTTPGSPGAQHLAALGEPLSRASHLLRQYLLESPTCSSKRAARFRIALLEQSE